MGIILPKGGHIMQMNYNESQTRKNLMRAFAGECQSRQRYYQAALIAQQQKLIGLERMFRFTAEQEERHAMVFWKLMKEAAGQSIDISAGFPADVFDEVQQLLDASGKEEEKEYISIIISETSRLSKLASNILSLTKLENQKTIGAKSRFSLDEQIRNIILVLEPEWSKKELELDIDLEDVIYVGNEELMAQIWQNIINNAIKFTPVGGNIRVRLFRSEKSIEAEIWNSGSHIDKAALAKVFEKFYQGDKSRATEGNGLGLALVKRIIELSQGSITVENDPAGGVSFKISLPYIIEDMM